MRKTTTKKLVKKELPTLASELAKVKAKKTTKKETTKKLVVTPEMKNWVYHICYVDRGNKFNSLVVNLPFSLSTVDGVAVISTYLRKITNDNYRALCSFQFVCEIVEKDLVNLENKGLISRTERNLGE